MLMIKKFIMGELSNRALAMVWKLPEKAKESLNRIFLTVFIGLFLRTVWAVICIACVNEYLYPVSSIPLAVTVTVAPYYFMAILFVREVIAAIKLGYTLQYEA